MPDIGELLENAAQGGTLADADAGALAGALGEVARASVYPASFGGTGDEVYAAARCKDRGRMVVVATKGGDEGPRFGEYAIAAGPWDANAAALLRRKFAFLQPSPVGPPTSIGLGDRLGCATGGHARAVRASGIAPVFAQQSIREMTRTHRTPRDVMDDATWGVFLTGWRKIWGADADHLKTKDDVDACAEARFVMYTIDPGEHVDDDAATDGADVLRRKLDAFPWGALETTEDELRARYSDVGLATDDEIARATAKYGRAIAHAAGLARYIKERISPDPFEIEISVDETASPTTPFEHRLVATELERLGVKFTGLAVRFVGEFEKGIDYKGDVAVFKREAEAHAQVARELGEYKLSVHSGSDKFSIYPILAEATWGAVHVKTAGTSYLEALRAVAELDLELFREIASVARARYEDDRKTYHVSGEASDVPEPGEITEGAAQSLLDNAGARQVFHVTYGSVLDAPARAGGTLGGALKRFLDENEELYWKILHEHLGRHVESFAAAM